MAGTCKCENQLSLWDASEYKQWKVVYTNYTSSYTGNQNDYYMQLTADLPDVSVTGGNFTYGSIVEASSETVWRCWNQAVVTVVQDEADRRAAAESVRLRAAQLDEQLKQQQEAAKKAEELLLMMITPQQAECYKKNGYFDTPINDRIYRLHKDRKVQRIDPRTGRPAVSYCIHVGPNATSIVPRPDELLAFKLMLEAEEPRFLHVANATAHPVL